MTKLLKPNLMLKATRLTRAGQLAEAAALVQRMLRGESAPDDATAKPADPELPAPTASAPARHDVFHQLRGLLDQATAGLNLKLPGLKQPAPPSAPDIVPDGGQFITATYSNPAGSRVYKLFIPNGYRGQPLPLIVMLHGCIQSPDDFAAGTRMNAVAQEQVCFVAYPAQPSNANPGKCWNWFRPGDQRRDQGEPSLIAGITRQIMSDYAVDTRRVYVGGLSAGAAAAAVLAATYPDLYAAVGVHSGLACGAASDVSSALAVMQHGRLGDLPVLENDPAVPTIVFHGDRDTKVHPRNGEHVVSQSMRSTNIHQQTLRGEVPGGHAYTRKIYSDASGRAVLEQWDIHGGGHAWSGGSPAGSFTDPHGPDATREMLRFFLQHTLAPTAT